MPIDPQSACLRGEKRLDERQVSGSCDLQQSGISVHDGDPSACFFDEGRAVGHVRKVALERATKRLREERLWRLRDHHAFAIDRLADFPSPDTFQRVGNRQHRNRALESLAQRSQQTLYHGMIEQRSRGVVNEHHERLLGHLGESSRDRFGSGGAPGDAGDDLRRGELFGKQDRRLLPARRRGDDDRVDELAAIETADALGQQRAPAESGERLRTIDAEPLARAGGRDQRPDTPAYGGNV